MTTLILVAILGAIFYRVSLALWPFTACRPCSGTGTNAGSNKKRWGSCRRCGGSGQKERLGVRLFARRR